MMMLLEKAAESLESTGTTTATKKSFKDILLGIWDQLVEWYQMYSDAIHSIFPTALGDLVVALIDIAVVALIIKTIAAFAFGTKSGEN